MVSSPQSHGDIGDQRVWYDVVEEKHNIQELNSLYSSGYSIQSIIHPSNNHPVVFYGFSFRLAPSFDPKPISCSVRIFHLTPRTPSPDSSGPRRTHSPRHAKPLSVIDPPPEMAAAEGPPFPPRRDVMRCAKGKVSVTSVRRGAAWWWRGVRRGGVLEHRSGQEKGRQVLSSSVFFQQHEWKNGRTHTCRPTLDPLIVSGQRCPRTNPASTPPQTTRTSRVRHERHLLHKNDSTVARVLDTKCMVDTFFCSRRQRV